VKNPVGLAAQATSEVSPAAEDIALLEFARSLATAEASGLGALYASLPGRFGPGRLELLKKLVWLRWAEVAPVEAVAWLKASAPNDVPMFLIAWSESDPAAAWRVATSDCLQARPALLRGLSDRLEREPPEAAIAILDAFPDEAMAEGDFVITRDAESSYAAAFHKFAAAEPARALERALELTGVRSAAALAGVAAARAEKNFSDALEWAQSIADEADRKAALGTVLVDLSRRDPEAAGALLKETDNPFESTTGGSGPGTIILGRMIPWAESPQLLLCSREGEGNRKKPAPRNGW
jgi:hypothetical protein